MATSISYSNAFKPAPKWYRITKKVVYGLFTTALFTSTLQRFGVSDKDVALIAGWIIAIMEMLGSVLANGQDYTDAKEDIGGGTAGTPKP